MRLLWLGGRDSNPDSQIQSLESYHWTTSQHEALNLRIGTGVVNLTLIRTITAYGFTPESLNLPCAANSAAFSGRYSQCHDSFDTVRMKPSFGALRLSHS